MIKIQHQKQNVVQSPARSSVNFANFEIRKFCLCFTMVVSQKLYLEAYVNNQYICLKNNSAQLYFILGKAELCLNFSSLLCDALIFIDFQKCTWLRLFPLGKSVNIRGIFSYTGKFKHSCATLVRVKCISCLCFLQNIFSHRPPL